MKQKVLLINDVDDLGKKGEVVEVRSGYARNFLLPQKRAIIASSHSLLIQEKLQKERAQQAIIDRKDAEELAKTLQNVVLTTYVKVDPEGRMYGSVSVNDILQLLKEEGFSLEKKNILLRKSIKETGIVDIGLKLKEDVEASVKLKILPETSQEDSTASDVIKEIVEEEEEIKKEQDNIPPTPE